MAGEKRGKFYEAIVGQALERAFPGCEVASQIQLGGSLIDSDWIVSRDALPEWMVLVTHSGSETKFTQKFYRDIAEVLQGLAATGGAIGTLSIVFDDRILEALHRAEKAIVNVVLRVGDTAAGRALIEVAEEKFGRGVVPKKADWAELSTRLDAPTLNLAERAIVDLATRISRGAALHRKVSGLGALLRPAKHLHRAERPDYSFYKGCSSLMLVPASKRSLLLSQAQRGRLKAQDFPWYLGRLIGTSAIGGRVPPVDLKRVSELFDHAIISEALEEGESDKAEAYRQLLDVGQFLPNFVRWLLADRGRCSPDSIDRLLQLAEQSPETALHKIDISIFPPASLDVNWVWAFLVSLCREIDGKKQSFGAKAIASITGVQRYTLQNSIISEFETRRWSMPTVDRERLSSHFSQVLLAKLSSVDVEKALKRFLHETYVDKLGPHAVHPIPAVVFALACRAKKEAKYEWVRTSFGEAVGAKGIAASVRVITCEGVRIWWRSAHEGHESDKSKEVGARLFGMTTQWIPSAMSFRRAASTRFIFVVDGDFSNEQVSFFERCGADVVLTPFELTTRLAAEVGW